MSISLFEACEQGDSKRVKTLIEEKVRRFVFI